MSDLGVIVGELGRIVGPARTEVVPPGLRRTRAEPRKWLVLIRPRTVDEVARVVRIASQHRKPVVIGGGTVQGRPVPREGGAIQLDMTGMERVIELDPRSHLVRVHTGISVAVLRCRLADQGLQLGWSLYTDAPHTLGGVLSGVPVRWGALYGDALCALRSMTVILPDGGMLREPVAPRRATGPDLGSLVLGTKGHLGVLVEATLRVFPEPASSTTLGVHLPVAELGQLHRLFLRSVRPHLLEIDAHADGLAHVVVSLHGRTTEVSRAMSILADETGATPVELLNPSMPGLTSGQARVVTWSAFAAFRKAWEADTHRLPFVADQVTMHSLRVVGGGAPAQAAAQRILDRLISADCGAALRHLEGLKRHLDPHSVLGRLFE